MARKGCTVAGAAVSVRRHDDFSVLREVSLVLKSSYENMRPKTCEPPKGAFKQSDFTHEASGDGCISKPVILKLRTVPGHSGLRASVSCGSGGLLSPRPWSVRDDGTFLSSFQFRSSNYLQRFLQPTFCNIVLQNITFTQHFHGVWMDSREEDKRMNV